jgi:hypothetical protein
MQSVRTVVRTLIAVFLATAAPVLAAPAVQAHAREAHQQSSGTDAAGSHKLTISIDGVTPNYATPRSTITVRGTVTNGTGSPLTGLQVQLMSSAVFFGTRSGMDSYTAGHDDGAAAIAEGTAVALPGALHSGKTVRWSASFSAASAGYPVFGVYPLAARVQYGDGTPSTAISRTLLPYWPGKDAAPSTALSVAWLWPLIDSPQQGMCGQTLATNSLAGSLGAGGRLSNLLAAGQRWAQRDRLTWVVDPALLSDASVMTQEYKVGGGSDCTGRQPERPSSAAASWLAALRQGAASEPMIITPYADADVAALSHAGLDKNIRTAYRLADSTTSQLLSRTGHGLIAWPAGGAASPSALTRLAHDGGASTVVLNSGQLPSRYGQYDDALSATKTGTGTTMGVLLADSGIIKVLGSASARSPAAAQFAAAQDFLAQTAMILAEGPSLQRSLVIAPPRRWNPSAAEASALLSMTTAPWLRSTDLSTLATAAGQLSARGRLPASPPGELSSTYTTQVAAADASAALYQDLLYKPGQKKLDTIDAAVTATTSAAWRGKGAAGGWHVLAMLGNNLNGSVQKVQIITGRNKILLGGASGSAPVSVQNLLPDEVQVRVVATPPPGGDLSVSRFDDLMRVPPNATSTIRVPLHSSAITTTTMQLQLQTEDRSPLPGTSQSLSVQFTRYGRALLVLIAAALGVLVLASVARWIRRMLNGGRADSELDNRVESRAEGRSGGTG